MKEYHFKRGNIAEVLQHIVGQYHDYLSQQGVKIRIAIEENVPDCRFDPLAVSQVIGNLLDNAIKFSPEQKNISLALSHQGGVIRLEVADHGVGMPADKIDTIFAPYSRLTNTFRGSGIGLSLVKHAIDAHGGTIEVLSTPGEGSTFIVTLPVMEAEDDA
jgi:signal transduction histidine kinase